MVMYEVGCIHFGITSLSYIYYNFFQLGMIKDCVWKGRRLSCSAIFSKQPTDRGMCCSFNKEKADKMFKESLYMEQIKMLTGQDNTHSAEDSTVPEW